MWTILQRRSPEHRTATELYGRAVAQARLPRFYADWAVPDTPEGRLEMVMLHVTLLLQRLGSGDTLGGRLARALSEVFITDMDDNMRELGIGDLSVPRKVKKAAAALFDRTVAVSAALGETSDDALAGIFARHVWAGAAAPMDAPPALAGYARRCADSLVGQSDADLFAGVASFPAP
jgi:cytochrome b pre-mRNA-processing protein 3